MFGANTASSVPRRRASSRGLRCLPACSPRPVVLVLVLFACIFYLTFPRPRQGLPLGCKALIRTKGSWLRGTPVARDSCDAVIGRHGGYCVCEGDEAVPAPRQRWPSVAACDDICARADPEALVAIPEAPSCSEGLAAFSWTPRRPPEHYTPAPQYEAVTALWQRIIAALDADDLVVLPPGPRTRDDDFAAKGLRMDAAHVALARKQWARFTDVVGDLPRRAFGGRGVAILAGGAPHFVPALVAVLMLRRTGCTLPVEMWFPADEVVAEPLVGKLRGLGVHVCSFYAPPSIGKGFYMKAAVVVLSSFEEVLLLDSDQVPVRDPTSLFTNSGYLATGALLWPDFWRATWARDAARIIDVRRKHMPRMSFESGQMLLNKTRVWPALVTALHFNLHNQLFYPLFSNYMGQGDKETFGMALKAHRLPYHLVPHRVRSLGYLARKCGVLWCWDDFVTDTMVQHDPQGRMMFLHTNMKPKWRLNAPADLSRPTRRWQTLNPGVEDRVQPWVDLSVVLFGYDIEMHIQRLLVTLRCDEDVFRVHQEHYGRSPDLLERQTTQQAEASAAFANAAGPQRLLPFLPEGIQLLNTYERTSLSGPFLRDQPPTLAQIFRHYVSYWTVGRGSFFHFLTWRRKASSTATRAALPAPSPPSHAA